MKRFIYLSMILGMLVLSACTVSQTMSGGGNSTATATNNQPVDSNNTTTLPPATTPEAS